MPIDPKQKEIWLRELQLNGFVILRDFLPVELVTRMYEELLPLIESEFRKAQEDNFAKGRNRGRQQANGCQGHHNSGRRSSLHLASTEHLLPDQPGDSCFPSRSEPESNRE